MKTPIYILIFLTISGFLLRLWNITGDLLHTDEQFTLNLVQHSWTYIIQYTLTQDCNPPLYYLFDKLSVIAWGNTYFGLRFPSLVFGTLLIPATYYLGKELKNENLGLLAASVVTFLGSLWYYSQFARAYMLVALLFTLLTICFIKITKGENAWLPFSVLAVLCFYTHLYAIIPIGFMLCYLIYLKRVKTILWASAIAVFSLPLVFLGISIIATRTGKVQSMYPWVGNTIPQLIQFIPLEYFGYLCVIFVLLIAYALWTHREVWVLAGIAGATIITQLIVSQITPVFVRYTLLLVPMLVTIAMLPVADILDGDSLKAQKVFILMVFYLLFLGVILYQYITPGFFLPKGFIPI